MLIDRRTISNLTIQPIHTQYFLTVSPDEINEQKPKLSSEKKIIHASATQSNELLIQITPTMLSSFPPRISDVYLENSITDDKIDYH